LPRPPLRPPRPDDDEVEEDFFLDELGVAPHRTDPHRIEAMTGNADIFVVVTASSCAQTRPAVVVGVVEVRVYVWARMGF